jgi:hypothetical protein
LSEQKACATKHALQSHCNIVGYKQPNLKMKYSSCDGGRMFSFSSLRFAACGVQLSLPRAYRPSLAIYELPFENLTTLCDSCQDAECRRAY